MSCVTHAVTHIGPTVQFIMGSLSRYSAEVGVRRVLVEVFTL